MHRHLLTVSPAIPDPASGGGGNWGSCFVRQFLARGHRVTHVAVLGKHAALGRERANELRAAGVELVVVPYQRREVAGAPLERLRNVLRPNVARLWPSEAATRPRVLEAVVGARPDCVLPFAFDAVIYTDGYHAAPRVGFQAEGPHVNTWVSWRYDPPVRVGLSAAYLAYSARMLLRYRAERSVYTQLTRGLTFAGFGGPHYVEWARRRGLRNAVFLTTPVPDPVGAGWRERRHEGGAGDRCRVLMIGHLHSTSNRSGLPLFFEQVLPALEREWGPERFEVHIVGRNDAMPARFDRWRSHPSLRFRGAVYPADDEFLRAHVLLVPIPAPTGSRVRILNGFSYGCCVVAHSANALGIPELRHAENALLASSGPEIARLVIRAGSDPALRGRLGEAGRAVYERHYTEAEGARQYLELIEEALQLHAAAPAT